MSRFVEETRQRSREAGRAARAQPSARNAEASARSRKAAVATQRLRSGTGKNERNGPHAPARSEISDKVTRLTSFQTAEFGMAAPKDPKTLLIENRVQHYEHNVQSLTKELSARHKVMNGAPRASKQPAHVHQRAVLPDRGRRRRAGALAAAIRACAPWHGAAGALRTAAEDPGPHGGAVRRAGGGSGDASGAVALQCGRPRRTRLTVWLAVDQTHGGEGAGAAQGNAVQVHRAHQGAACER